MNESLPGDRVGAILSADPQTSTVNFLGYGTYEGNFVPPFGPLNTLHILNPRIKLDSGETVWGCECWWGSEARIKATLAKAKHVVAVSITEQRKHYPPCMQQRDEPED